MKSIKEYNTSGMTYLDRLSLFNKVIPIPIGEEVFRAGDAWEYTKLIKVTPANQKEVTMFWNSLYFDTEAKADLRTAIAHAEYSSYQANCCFY